MWFVMSRVTRSPMGRTFRAIRDDHVVAAALGKDVFRMQLKSMLIGSFYAGIGGGLLIQFGGSFNPTAWLPGETFVVFAVLIVGGVGEQHRDVRRRAARRDAPRPSRRRSCRRFPAIRA